MRQLLYAAIILYLCSLFLVALYHLKRSDASWLVLELVTKALVTAGLLVHTAALVLRIYSTGHAPMSSMYETLLFYSWTVVLVTIIVIYRYEERMVELVTVPVALLTLFFAFARETSGGPLPLVLKTRWFEVHVIASFIAYAFFTLAFSGALFSLIHEHWRLGEDHIKRFQYIASRSVLWGFCFFSLAMFSGAVWAYLAWGIYWLWEPKSIWSFIVWFYYAGAMHAYYVKEWKGRGLSIAVIIGFFVVIFTYLGVSLLMKSSHNF